jgi:phosphomannomutase/phosphoglucomutase
MSIYKACDIRGIAGKDLTAETYDAFGRGLAAMMGPQRRIVVGGDLRISTPQFRAALVRALSEAGKSVVDLGVVPTPAVYFAKRHLGAYACAVVTASHNPFDHNGLKFMLGSLPVTPEDVGRLAEFVAHPPPRVECDPATALNCPELAKEYEGFLRSTLEVVAPEVPAPMPLRVVVDAGNGTFWKWGPEFMGRLPGVEAQKLFCLPDGYFPGRDPNCAAPENLVDLCARVRERKAGLGVAFDGDGDRVAFVDDEGCVLHPDEVMVTLMRALGGRMRGRMVVYDLKCSRVIEREARRLGAVAQRERSGHAFIKRRMIAEDADLGGEVSGHYFWRELGGGDDGLFTAMLLARLLQKAGRPLSALRRETPARFITPDIRLACAPEAGARALERLKAAFPPERLSELDGVCVEFDRGWGLMRISITEPKITLRFEGEDAGALAEVMERFLSVVPEFREGAMRAAKPD